MTMMTTVRARMTFTPCCRDGGAVDRQPAQRDAGRRIDRVAQRRRTGRAAGFADAARVLAALDDMHVDVRHLVDAQHAVIVEVGLLHAALLDRDLAVQRGGQAEDQPALQLRDDGIGIDRDAGVHRRRHPAQMHLAVIVDFGFDDGGDEAGE